MAAAGARGSRGHCGCAAGARGPADSDADRRIGTRATDAAPRPAATQAGPPRVTTHSDRRRHGHAGHDLHERGYPSGIHARSGIEADACNEADTRNEFHEDKPPGHQSSGSEGRFGQDSRRQHGCRQEDDRQQDCEDNSREVNSRQGNGCEGNGCEDNGCEDNGHEVGRSGGGREKGCAAVEYPPAGREGHHEEGRLAAEGGTHRGRDPTTDRRVGEHLVSEPTQLPDASDEAFHSQGIETEPASTAPASTEPTNTEPASTEPANTEPDRTEEASPPHTGDLVIDSALRDLAETSGADLDAVLEQGSALEGVLRARLGDLDR